MAQPSFTGEIMKKQIFEPYEMEYYREPMSRTEKLALVLLLACSGAFSVWCLVKLWELVK